MAYESLCPAVHKTLLAGTCPWCGQSVLNGQAQNPELLLLSGTGADHAALELALRRIADQIFARRPRPSAAADSGDPQATDDLLMIFEQIGGNDSKAVPLLCAALQDTDWSVRWAAANALGRLGASARDALPALRSLLQDEDPIVREAVSAAVKSIDRAEPEQPHHGPEHRRR